MYCNTKNICFFLKYSAGDVSAFFTTVLKFFANWKKNCGKISKIVIQLWIFPKERSFLSKPSPGNLESFFNCPARKLWWKFSKNFAQCAKAKKNTVFHKKNLSHGKFLWTYKIQFWKHWLKVFAIYPKNFRSDCLEKKLLSEKFFSWRRYFGHFSAVL